MLQKLQQIKKRQEGFTIIEVLIVLAIAGLILLIVFLAVPALERNQRNTGRKSDAGHISTAINDFISNNNGTFPVAGTGVGKWAGATGDCSSIQDDAGTLNQFTTSKITCNTGTTMVAGDFNMKVLTANYTTTVVASGAGDALLFAESATCGTDNGNTVDLVFGTTSQAALVYTLESGGTDYNQACVTVQ